MDVYIYGYMLKGGIPWLSTINPRTYDLSRNSHCMCKSSLTTTASHYGLRRCQCRYAFYIVIHDYDVLRNISNFDRWWPFGRFSYIWKSVWSINFSFPKFWAISAREKVKAGSVRVSQSVVHGYSYVGQTAGIAVPTYIMSDPYHLGLVPTS